MQMYTHAAVAQHAVHHPEVGRMKQLGVLCLRLYYPADMLAYTPSSSEVAEFRKMPGLCNCHVAKDVAK